MLISGVVEKRVLLGGALLLVLASLLGRPGVSAEPPALLLALGGLMAVLTSVVYERHGGSSIAPLVAIGLLVWGGLCSAFSLAPYLSKLALLNLTASTGLILAFYLGVTSMPQWRLGAHLLVLGAFLSSLNGWPTYLAAEAPRRFHANFTNPDSFSIIPLVGLCLAGALLARASGWRLGWLLLASSVLLPTLLLTRSRSGALALLVAVCCVALSGWRLRKRAISSSLKRLALAALPTMILCLYAVPNYARWTDPANTAFALSIRASLLKGSLACGWERPLLGSGPGTFALAFQEFRVRDVEPFGYANVAHNDFMQFLVETGVPGMLLWSLLLLLALRSAFAGLGSAGRVAESAWAGAGLMALAVYSLFNFATPVPTTLIWWSAVIGLALALPNSKGQLTAPASRSKLLATGMLALAGAWSCCYGLNLERSRRLAGQAEELQVQAQQLQAFQTLGHAIQLQPDNSELRLARAALALELAKSETETSWLKQAEHDLRRAREANPRDLQGVFQSYRFLLAQDRLEEVDELLAEAHSYAPYQPYLCRYRAASLLRQRDLQGAAQTLARVGGVELANVLVALETEQSGAGMATLREVPQEQSEATAQAMLGIAAREKLPAVVDSVGSYLLDTVPDPLAWKLSWAQSLSQAGDSKGATRLLTEIVESKRIHHHAYEAALIDLAPTRATDFLIEQLKLNPRMAKVRVLLSRQLSTGEAVELLNAGLRLQPSNPELLTALGDVYAADGVHEVAATYYSRARDERTKSEKEDKSSDDH